MREEETIRKKIVLSFVGKRDPRDNKKGTEGSIVTLCKELKPDRVYLFPTTDSSDVNQPGSGASVKEYILKENKKNGEFGSCEIIIRPLCIQDPTDFNAISERFYKEIQRLFVELQPIESYDVYMNSSSGTPQMSVVGYVFANSGIWPGISCMQCKDPYYVNEGDPRCIRVETTFLEANYRFKQALDLLDCYNYSVLRESMAHLSEIAFLEEKKRVARVLKKAFTGYQHMDSLRYKEALDLLKEAFDDCDGYKKAREIFSRQLTKLEALVSTGGIENKENLTDLLYNMKRSFARGAYIDVLARFRRLAEGVTYLCLRQYGIEPQNPVGSSSKENLEKLKAFFEERYCAQYDPTRSLDYAFARRVLKEVFDDEKYKTTWDGHKKKINELEARRNKTIAAHGMAPVKELDAEASIGLAEVILDSLVDGVKEEKESYPFKLENIREIVKELWDVQEI